MPSTIRKTVDQAATDRVSIRKYTNEAVEQSELSEILTLAGRAPSPFNVQPWRFHVVTNHALKERLQEAGYGQPQIGASWATVVLVNDVEDALANIDEAINPAVGTEVGADIKGRILGYFGGLSAEERTRWGHSMSYIALGYLLLLLEGRDLGSSPMTGFVEAKVKEVLELPDRVTVAALIAIGNKNEAGLPQHRSPISRTIVFHE